MNLDLEFSKAYLETRLTKQEAADFLGVDITNIRRMLNGSTRPKRGYIQAFKMLAGFAPVMSRRDKEFKSWRFKDGKLWTDENMGYSAAEIRSIWHVDQLLKGQDKHIRELKSLVNDLRATITELQAVPAPLPNNVIAFPLSRSSGDVA